VVLQGVQQLGPVLSPGMQEAGIASMSYGLGDDASSKPGEPFTNRASRLAGPGIGKPAFDSECGKKGSVSRQRVRFILLSYSIWFLGYLFLQYVHEIVCFVILMYYLIFYYLIILTLFNEHI